MLMASCAPSCKRTAGEHDAELHSDLKTCAMPCAGKIGAHARSIAAAFLWTAYFGTFVFFFWKRRRNAAPEFTPHIMARRAARPCRGELRIARSLLLHSGRLPAQKHISAAACAQIAPWRQCLLPAAWHLECRAHARRLCLPGRESNNDLGACMMSLAPADEKRFCFIARDGIYGHAPGTRPEPHAKKGFGYSF